MSELASEKSKAGNRNYTHTHLANSVDTSSSRGGGTLDATNDDAASLAADMDSREGRQ